MLALQHIEKLNQLFQLDDWLVEKIGYILMVLYIPNQ